MSQPQTNKQVDTTKQHISVHQSQISDKQQNPPTLANQQLSKDAKYKEDSKPSISLLPSCHKLKQKSMLGFGKGDKIFNQKKKMAYQLLELLGEGTFGQVFMCRSSEGYRMAVKIFKKQPAYINQGLLQVKMLREISKAQKMTNGSKQHYLNLYDAFMWQGILCVAMEVMDNSLLEILQSSNFRGLQMKWIQTWAKELILFLTKMHSLGIYHCDIKPENIMFRPQKPEKPVLIDFSSACTQNFQPFYRAPEVLLGLKPYGQKIDIWSLGCSLVQLYLGLPLFPGGCSYDQLQKICKLIPHESFPIEEIERSEFGKKYFKIIEEGIEKSIVFKTIEQFKQVQGNSENLEINEDCYKFENLNDILSERNCCPKELQSHELFLDLIKKMLVFDPNERISAEDAFLHPFIGGIFSELEQTRQIQDLKIKAKIS